MNVPNERLIRKEEEKAREEKAREEEEEKAREEVKVKWKDSLLMDVREIASLAFILEKSPFAGILPMSARYII